MRLRLVIGPGPLDLEVTQANVGASVHGISLDAPRMLAISRPSRAFQATWRSKYGFVRGMANSRSSPFTSTRSGPPMRADGSPRG